MKKKPVHHKAKAKAASSSTRVSTVVKKQYSEEMRSFLVHAILYFLVNFGLFIYFYSNGQSLTLFYWVVAGWGVGLVAHAMAVFGIMKFLHKEW